MTSYDRASIEAWRRFLDHTSDGAGSVSPLDALKLSTALVGLVAAWQREQVAGALAEGASWQDIGDALGIHPDTAFRRFSDLKIGRIAPEYRLFFGCAVSGGGPVLSGHRAPLPGERRALDDVATIVQPRPPRLSFAEQLD